MCWNLSHSCPSPQIGDLKVESQGRWRIDSHLNYSTSKLLSSTFHTFVGEDTGLCAFLCPKILGEIPAPSVTIKLSEYLILIQTWGCSSSCRWIYSYVCIYILYIYIAMYVYIYHIIITIILVIYIIIYILPIVILSHGGELTGVPILVTPPSCTHVMVQLYN